MCLQMRNLRTTTNSNVKSTATIGFRVFAGPLSAKAFSTSSPLSGDILFAVTASRPRCSTADERTNNDLLSFGLAFIRIHDIFWRFSSLQTKTQPRRDIYFAWKKVLGTQFSGVCISSMGGWTSTEPGQLGALDLFQPVDLRAVCRVKQGPANLQSVDGRTWN